MKGKNVEADADYWQRVLRTGYIILVYISSVSMRLIPARMQRSVVLLRRESSKP